MVSGINHTIEVSDVPDSSKHFVRYGSGRRAFAHAHMCNRRTSEQVLSFTHAILGSTSLIRFPAFLNTPKFTLIYTLYKRYSPQVVAQDTTAKGFVGQSPETSIAHVSLCRASANLITCSSKLSQSIAARNLLHVCWFVNSNSLVTLGQKAKTKTRSSLPTAHKASSSWYRHSSEGTHSVAAFHKYKNTYTHTDASLPPSDSFHTILAFFNNLSLSKASTHPPEFHSSPKI